MRAAVERRLPHRARQLLAQRLAHPRIAGDTRSQRLDRIEAARHHAVSERVGERAERAVPPQVDRRGVVAEHQRPVGIGVEKIHQAVAGDPLLMPVEQREIEPVPRLERVPRRASREAVGIEIAVRAGAALVRVHERQPVALRPEAPQHVAPVVVRREQAPAQAVTRDEVAGGSRKIGGVPADAEADLGPRPLGQAHQHARRRHQRRPPAGATAPRRPADLACPRRHVGGQIRRRHHGQEPGEALAEDRLHGEQRARHRLDRVDAPPARPPYHQHRPQDHPDQEPAAQVKPPHRRQRFQLADQVVNRLVPPHQEVLDRRPQPAPSERIDERDRHRARQRPPERPAPETPLSREVNREQREPEVVGDVKVRPRPRDGEQRRSAAPAARPAPLQHQDLERDQEARQ